MIKEWRNGVLNHMDKIILVGVIDRQYLYSCSIEGIFIIRDLVNDDEDESSKQFKLQAPISCIRVALEKRQLKVVIGSKNYGLKYYEILLDKQYLFDDKLPNINTSYVVTLNQLRSLLKNQGEKNREKLTAKWEASVFFETYWLTAIEFWKHLIICGTQFGFILIYDRCQVTPVKIIKNTSAPINNLKVVGNNLIYTDMMSQVGVFDMRTMEQTNWFDCKFGIVEFNKIFISQHTFKIIVIASTSDGRIKMVKVLPNNTCQVLHDVRTDYPIECFLMIPHNSHSSPK